MLMLKMCYHLAFANCSNVITLNICTNLHCSIPVLKMNKSIVFKFLHTLQLPKFRESLLQQFLSYRGS